MDKSKDLLLKLNSGNNKLTEAEANLVIDLLQTVKLSEKEDIKLDRNFIHHNKKFFKVGLPTDRCFSCGRPY